MKKFAFLLLILNCTLRFVKADWVQVNNGLTQHNVNALCAYTSGSVNYIFAGTLQFPSSLFVSTNSGNSWSVSWQIPNNVWALASTSGGGNNYVFAGTGNGMGFTSNNGANWYSAGLPHEIYSITASGNNVFAGCKWWSYDSGGVYRSTNLGVNWIRTLYGPEIHALAINGNNVYAGAGGGANLVVGVFKSTDTGTTWAQTPFANTTVYSLAINGNNIFAGTSSLGVYLSTNSGMNWTQTSLNNATIMSLLVFGNTIFAGGYGSGGFLISTNNGLNWQVRNEGGVGGIRALSISDSYVFAGTDGGGVYRRPLSELVGIKPISSEVPENFKLFQNFPNPFNSNTKIKFQISKNSDVKLILFDVLGRQISKLVNEELNRGIYEVEWNGNDFSSGIYICRLIINNEIISSKKLVLNK